MGKNWKGINFGGAAVDDANVSSARGAEAVLGWGAGDRTGGRCALLCNFIFEEKFKEGPEYGETMNFAERPGNLWVRSFKQTIRIP